jgi:diguanylate cyclase (GGDEF)-like protein
MEEKLGPERIASPVSGAESNRFALSGPGQMPGSSPGADLELRIGALRDKTGAALAAVLLVDGPAVVIRTMSATGAAADEVCEMSATDSPVEQLVSRARSLWRSDRPPACAETSVVVEDEVVGWVAIVDHFGRQWNESDRRALADAASWVLTDVKLGLANRETARLLDLVASHNRLHDLIAQDAPLSDVLGELVEGIERYEPSVLACVVLLDRESSTLHPVAGPSLPAHWLAAMDGVVIGPNVGACGSAAWSGDLTITEDIGEDSRWAPVRDFAIDAGLRHCWSMPIKAADGDVLGTFALYGPKPRRPQPEHLTLMHDGARLAGIAIERHRTMQRLIHDARHDGLTGLPNRRAIFDHLDYALPNIAPENHVAVLFVDLDGLKTLNDTLGHDQADEMIREIGGRLSEVLAVDDFVGRFGGDEFVVVKRGVADNTEAAEVGFRLLDAISKPLAAIQSTVVTASIGIALISDPDTDAPQAIRQADNAMYTAKRAGRDRCSLYGERAPSRANGRHSLAHALRDAEVREEMSLVFQPVFEVASFEVVAVEALLRWSSPEFGEVSPAAFIAIAESTGAILPLGAWVLREGCETLARVAEVAGRRLELAVNVSAHQLAKPGFARAVYQTLRHAELGAELLTLEVTETALMHPDANSARTLAELESLGVRIVLDDFGTGYSSLTWLKDHPIHGIKIDRSFVTDLPGDAASRGIVEAVIGMAHALGCTVTAEGVETKAQLEALQALGCERVQGFLLGRPAPIDEIAALVAIARPSSATPDRPLESFRAPGQRTLRLPRADAGTRTPDPFITSL